MTYLQINRLTGLTQAELNQLIQRPTQQHSAVHKDAVQHIINQVRTQGDQALIELTEKLDLKGGKLESLILDKNQIDFLAQEIDKELANAIQIAHSNISKFHQVQFDQIKEPLEVETYPGVNCQQIFRPIEKVGLYVPGGTASLFSTLLMTAIPAKIAGCSQTIVVTPPPVSAPIAFVAKLCGIEQIYTIGGAQAIAALAYGTQTVPQVQKIFGPGNSWVTQAKQIVSQDPNGATIDMPAGPSEVLVIADNNADPAYVAADLLAQAEHGADSQVVLLSTSSELVEQVNDKIKEFLEFLPRAQIIKHSLKNSVTLVGDLNDLIKISNQYAPEHLIISTENAAQILDQFTNAASIFVGYLTPESAGDYASGTNHVLPTSGFAKSSNALGVLDYVKRITVQILSTEGVNQLGPVVTKLATTEELDAHALAMELRIHNNNKN